MFGNDSKFTKDFLTCAKRAGEQMWELPLAPNQTQRFQAIYKVSVPKDANVPNLP